MFNVEVKAGNEELARAIERDREILDNEIKTVSVVLVYFISKLAN